MKIIENIKELEGKIIKKAISLDHGEKVGLLFNDDTYCSIGVCYCGDSYELELDKDGDISLLDLKNLGMISESDFKYQREKQIQNQKQAQENRELEQYKQLKEKYGKND